jgi:hypothetical protein
MAGQAKRPQFLLVFDTQITSITRTKSSPSIFVFTFDAPALLPRPSFSLSPMQLQIEVIDRGR